MKFVARESGKNPKENLHVLLFVRHETHRDANSGPQWWEVSISSCTKELPTKSIHVHKLFQKLVTSSHTTFPR